MPGTARLVRCQGGENRPAYLHQSGDPAIRDVSLNTVGGSPCRVRDIQCTPHVLNSVRDIQCTPHVLNSVRDIQCTPHVLNSVRDIQCTPHVLELC